MRKKLRRFSNSQIAVRNLLGVFLILAGTGHLTFMRKAFLAQVPNWVPLDADLVVLLSGVVEIILGIGLLIASKNLPLVGWIVAIFFVLVFPGNIAQLVNRKHEFGLNSDLKLWLRLPLQPVLIIIALWCTGAWQEWKEWRAWNKNHRN